LWSTDGQHPSRGGRHVLSIVIVPIIAGDAAGQIHLDSESRD
jgi:hypothetical protein